MIGKLRFCEENVNIYNVFYFGQHSYTNIFLLFDLSYSKLKKDIYFKNCFYLYDVEGDENKTSFCGVKPCLQLS